MAGWVVVWVLEGFMGWWWWGGWLEGSWGGWVCGCVGGGGMGYWRVHGVGAYNHPPMNSYNVKIFIFMKTHPPTHRTYLKCHSVTIHILWRVHGVGWVVEEFMGGCIYSSTHELLNHPPHYAPHHHPHHHTLTP